MYSKITEPDKTGISSYNVTWDCETSAANKLHT